MKQLIALVLVLGLFAAYTTVDINGDGVHQLPPAPDAAVAGDPGGAKSSRAPKAAGVPCDKGSR